MWGGVGAGNLGVSLQTQPSQGMKRSAQDSSTGRLCVFRAPRRRDRKNPNSTKQNNTWGWGTLVWKYFDVYCLKKH